MRLNIRTKLTLWITFAFALALFGFAALVYSLLERALYRQVDRTLAASLQLLAGDPAAQREPDRRLAYWIEEYKEHQNLYCAVFGPDGSLIDAHPELPRAQIPQPPRLEPGERYSLDVAVGPLGRQRSHGQRQNVGGRDRVVVLFASLNEVDHQLSDVRGVMATSIPFALLCAGGLAYLLARRALAPVDRLRRAAEEISAERLDRRLEVKSPHDELGRLGHTMNAMIARLERSFTEMRRFTADASHELRTPLTAIRIETEVALAGDLNVEGHRQLLASVLEECERMTRITEQLLTLAREDAGVAAHVRETIELQHLIEKSIETIRPVAEVKGVTLTAKVSQAVTLRGDPVRLRQVFLNLLDNAIKYTPCAGTVQVAVEQHGGSAIVTVEDTGIGISSEHLPHVFERFFRVDKARTRAEGGTGLGLSIARSIVEAHGGVIRLESVVGRGTRCVITLPLGEHSSG